MDISGLHENGTSTGTERNALVLERSHNANHVFVIDKKEFHMFGIPTHVEGGVSVALKDALDKWHKPEKGLGRKYDIIMDFKVALLEEVREKIDAGVEVSKVASKTAEL